MLKAKLVTLKEVKTIKSLVEDRDEKTPALHRGINLIYCQTSIL
jgi:hypothetical protein